MLRNGSLVSRSGCSQAPRGLFVLSWVTRIFTGTAISPSPLSRQRPGRSSFRAGRNLPDKEFRYLRTVRVTAAVHWGFPGKLRSPASFTFRHWAGVSPYISASAFAGTCVFGKQSPGPIPAASSPALACSESPLGSPSGQHQLLRRPFFRRYGAKLPSSLTEAHSFTSGAYLPAYQCRFAVRAEARLARGFSWR